MKMSRLGALHFTKHTGAKHSATVIFFHGSGSTGPHMLEWVKLMVKNFSFPHIKVLYPTAPLQPYTPAEGSMSNVWFDRGSVSLDAPDKLESLASIEVEVKNLIKKENDAGIPSSRIIVGGFSMGGALSLHTAYRWEKNVAGVFVLSSFLYQKSVVFEELKNSGDIKLPPLLQIHGNQDDVVDLKWAEATFENLKALGVQGQFHIQDRLGHHLNKRGIILLQKWIEELLPEN